MIGPLIIAVEVLVGVLIAQEHGAGAGLFAVIVLIFLGRIGDELVEFNDRHFRSTSHNTNFSYEQQEQ